MSKETKTLEELVSEMALEYRHQLRAYVESLLATQRGEPRKKPRFTWAGALKDLQDRYTSVELQHQIARWRINGE